MNWQPNHPAFQTLLATFVQETAPLYAVGGVVRDHLLGREQPIADLDIVVVEPALPLAQRVADSLGWAFYALDEGRELARLVFSANSEQPLVCDVSRIRGGSLDADLLSRDFTLNAMAFLVEDGGRVQLIDYHNGQQDLQQGILRQVTGASIPEDPIRMLRAVRLANQFGMEIEQATRHRIQECTSLLRISSPDRVRDELWKMMATARPDQAVDEMRVLGLLPYALSELADTIDVEQTSPHHLDVYHHTRLAMRHAAQLRDWLMANPWRDQPRERPDEVTMAWQQMLLPWRVQLHNYFSQIVAGGRRRAEWLVWYALLHDIGKPKTATVEQQKDNPKRIRFYEHEGVGAKLSVECLNHLRFSRQEINRAKQVVLAHMRPHHLHSSFRERGISRRAIYRFVRDLEGDKAQTLGETLPASVDTTLLAWADYQAIHARLLMTDWQGYLEHIRQLLAFVFEDQGNKDARRRPIIDGHMLMQHLNLSPGPIIGRLMAQVLEGQAAGEVDTQEHALQLAQQALESMTTEGRVAG